MTRETKIGLLVGLAFIIVIGILLSDHMTSSNELPQASLNTTGNTVRDGLTSPAAALAETPSGTTVIITRPVTPRQPVQTAGELSPQPIAPGAPTESIVRVGPGVSQSPIQIRQTPQAPAAPGAPEQVATNRNSIPPIAPVSPSGADAGPAHDSSIPDAIQQIANQQNEPLVPVGVHPETPKPNALLVGATKHVAEEGDNLSRLAAKYLGSSGKTAREAIVKANPSLAADPNRIIVGRTYIIPAASAVAAAAAAQAQAPTQTATASPTAPAPAPGAPAPIAPAAAPTAAPADPNTVWYTVKENDSLWSIAADQLGSGTKYTEIKKLNQEALKNGDTVTVNMRLLLPAKQPIASIR